jgi:hypothetical protein
MKKIKAFIFVCIICSVTTSYSQVILPKDLDEAILYFQQNWTKKELTNFKTKRESDAVIDLHFGVGLWIRNTWVRGKRDTALTNYFHSFGIDEPDDISSVILTSLHRKLNNKPINLVKQGSAIQAYYKPIISCEQKMKAAAVSNYNKFKTGDNVSIYMAVNENKNAVIYMCPNITWPFNTKTDLLIKGEVVNKYFINDSSNVFFTVKINKMNRDDVQALMTNVKVGDIKDFSLYGLKVE